MSKKIHSPVEEFPGHLVVAEPLSLPQVIDIQHAIRDAEGAREGNENLSTEEYYATLLPAFTQCVEEWGLDGWDKFPVWPGTPTKASAELAAWLINSIMELFKAANPDPNE